MIVKLIIGVLGVVAFMLIASACLVGFWLLIDRDAENAPATDEANRGAA